MKDNVFVDSNIIIYARTNDDIAKHKQAKAFFIAHSKDNIFISTQVLSESYNALRRHGVAIADRHATIDYCIRKMNVLSVTTNTVKLCLELEKQYGYSYWDSLILAAAFDGNCSVIYSEDMQHGQIINSKLKIINPFA